VRRAAAALAVVAAAFTGTTPALAARSIGAALRAARPAAAPFPGLTATVVHVGARPVAVVLARTEAERETGLRQRSTLGPYGGMLFVLDHDLNVAFTMSRVPVPLDVAFYRADGRRVGKLRMVPCAGSDATCPAYEIHPTFRYALETLAGQLPRGNLSG
jgi:uncharacterized membrane protein (UPF0127 family)